MACTLEAAAVAGRLAQWQVLLARAAAQHTDDDGTLHLRFTDTAVLEELARLVGLEQACCAFFTFVITVDASGVRLKVQAPAEATGLVGELFASQPGPGR